MILPLPETNDDNNDDNVAVSVASSVAAPTATATAAFCLEHIIATFSSEPTPTLSSSVICSVYVGGYSSPTDASAANPAPTTTPTAVPDAHWPVVEQLFEPLFSFAPSARN